MQHNAAPLVTAGDGELIIENLYLIPDPDDGEDYAGCTTYSAAFYDPDNEPPELVQGPVGAVPLKMTSWQALVLREALNKAFGSRT